VRPFEAGDLLILNDSTQCELMSFSIQKHTISTEFRSGDVLLDVKIYSGKWYGTYFENGNNVKTIRKPRKGGKEARDIVAMVGREHHRYLLNMLKIWIKLDDEIETIDDREADYWRARKLGKLSLQSLSFMLFQNAKSMLRA